VKPESIAYGFTGLINPAIKLTNFVLPDLIRQPVSTWVPAFAGITAINLFSCRSNINRG
jgi:hypothetical protein